MQSNAFVSQLRIIRPKLVSSSYAKQANTLTESTDHEVQLFNNWLIWIGGIWYLNLMRFMIQNRGAAGALPEGS